MVPRPFNDRKIVTVKKNVTDDFQFEVRIFSAKFFEYRPHLFQIMDTPMVTYPTDGYPLFFDVAIFCMITVLIYGGWYYCHVSGKLRGLVS